MPRIVLAVVLVLVAVGGFAQNTQPDALAEYRLGRFDQAISITLDELQANANSIESYVVLGWSLNAVGRFQEALDYGLRGLQVNQFEHRIIQIVAESNVKLGNNIEALEYLERYVQVAPTGSYIDWVYFAMGEIFISFGEYHRADIAISTSVYHNSRSAVRWTRLGYAREQLGEWNLALQAYNRALQLDPNLGDAVRGSQRVRSQIAG